MTAWLSIAVRRRQPVRPRIQRGRSPNLDALGERPLDPYTGRALEYRLEGEGYVLRSPSTEDRAPAWTRNR